MVITSKAKADVIEMDFTDVSPDVKCMNVTHVRVTRLFLLQ
jgi:hypothetical protein